MPKFITLMGRCGDPKAVRVDDICTVETEQDLPSGDVTCVTLFNGTQFLVKEPLAAILKQIDAMEKGK